MLPSRRAFIKQSSLAAAAVLVDKSVFKASKRKIGLQLYTLRNEMGKDAKGTLQKVGQLGYQAVETFGYGNGKWWGMTPAELSGVLKDNGLTSPSGHTFPGGFLIKGGWEDNWKKAVDDSKALGQEYVVIPWLEPDLRNSADNFKKLAAELNKAGAICKSAGMKLAYHNHDFEFAEVAGERPYHILLQETDAALVSYEMDIYWVKKGGQDPIELINAHPGRFQMWHVKDMDNTDKKFFTEVGNGTIDFKSIFAKAKESGLRHFFVEQDICPGNPMDSIAKSLAYIKKNLV